MENIEEFNKNQERMSKMTSDDLRSALNSYNDNDADQVKSKPSTLEAYSYEEEIVANKQLRKDIDEKIQTLSSLPKSRERALAITKLEEGVMWLGMDLKRLGAQNPYPNSKDPNTGSKVDQTADGLKFSN